MDIDTTLTRANLITRAIDTIDRDGKPAKLLTASRIYPTSVEDLWDAVTNVDRLSRWFLPVSGDLVLGSRYDLEGNASGTILECDPPNSFSMTWELGGDTSWVTVEIRGESGGTEARLDLRHVAHVPDELWDVYGPGAGGIGWDLGLTALALHLSSSGDLALTDVREWERSPDGREFVARASEAWAESSIAAGTDAESAHESAQRVTDFYTTEDE